MGSKKNKTEGTPDSPFNRLVFFLVKIWQAGRKKPVIDDDLLKEADTPYLLLANHEYFEDFYSLYQLSHPKKPYYVVNKHICTRPVIRALNSHIGNIPKKLFTGDLGTVVGIKRKLKKGYPVILYPEGRLSPDGRSNPVVEKGGAFYKRLDADIVLVKIDGGYYMHPKWRRRPYRSDTKITVKRVLKRGEISGMSSAELDRIIEETLYNDASLITEKRYHQRDKAEGLEGILYRCAGCGVLYRMTGKGNELRCNACGRVFRLDDSYHFTESPYSIPGYYDIIRSFEEREINGLSLRADVSTKVFDDDGKTVLKEDGVCTMDRSYFRYRSGTLDFEIPTDKIPALAFSCKKEFELYHDNKLYYFYPKTDPVQTARWALIIDILTAEKERSCEGK